MSSNTEKVNFNNDNGGVKPTMEVVHRNNGEAITSETMAAKVAEQKDEVTKMVSDIGTENIQDSKVPKSNLISKWRAMAEKNAETWKKSSAGQGPQSAAFFQAIASVLKVFERKG